MNRAVATYGVGDAIICTQSVNVARSIYLARQAGIDAVGLALPTPLERVDPLPGEGVAQDDARLRRVAAASPPDARRARRLDPGGALGGPLSSNLESA